MSLKHAILGLLTIQPMTGYDLKHEAFDETVAHFWQADQAQIYRTLDRMEADGWLESEIEVQTDRPNRRVYTITEAGRAQLMNWLDSPQPPPVYREPFLVQLFFADMLPGERILEHIDRHIAAHRERLAVYGEIAFMQTEDAALIRKLAFWRMTLDLGIALERTYLDWLERCRQTVEAMSGDGTEE